jgi:CRISPR-associated protein Cmr4
MPVKADDATKTPLPAASVLFLMAETPVHAGAGSQEAALDLPIQRSVQTKWPIIADGTLRGGLRSRVRVAVNDEKAKELFGHEEKASTDADTAKSDSLAHAGFFSTPDAEILLFPVASARGMTAWVTCPAAIEYFKRKLDIFQPRLSPEAQQAVAALGVAAAGALGLTGDTALVTRESEIAWAGAPRKLILETDSHVVGDTAVDDLAGWFADHAIPLGDYWRKRVRSHFAVVSDEAFQHYTARKTDIRTRIRVSNGRVEGGGLWTEENLPVDTLLYTALCVSGTGKPEHLQELDQIVGLGARTVIQLGGDQNLGRGVLRVGKLGGKQQ